MPLNVSCQGCGKGYAVPDERAGQRFKCRECGAVVSVPADEWEFSSNETAYSGGFSDTDNPYAAPTSLGANRSVSRNDALSKTKVCAIFLFIVTGFSMVYHLFVGVSILFAVAATPAAFNQQGVNDAAAAERMGQLFGGIAGGTIGIVMDVLVILGAYNLMNLKKYSLAMTGAIVACIPCCGPCLVLGIPFGIWALVLLNNPDIKRHFQR